MKIPDAVVQIDRLIHEICRRDCPNDCHEYCKKTTPCKVVIALEMAIEIMKEKEELD